VIQDDELTLFRGAAPLRRFSGLEPPLYTQLKTLAHVPLAVYCLLLSQPEGRDLPDDVLVELRAYRDALEGAAAELSIGDGLLSRPVAIHVRSCALLDDVIGQRQVAADALATYARASADDLHLLIAAAARAQLDACHACMMQIRSLLDAGEWDTLRVLVLGAYMAREGELFLQYFSRLLGTPEQGDRRLVYFEGEDVALAYDRLGTAMLDALAARDFFRDPDRLHRDVLADDTARYLDMLLGPAACAPSMPP